MEEEEPGLRHSTFEIPARHPSGEIRRDVRHVTQEYRVKVQDGNLHLGLTSIQMVYNAKREKKRMKVLELILKDAHIAM